jgi:hypothetical protein
VYLQNNGFLFAMSSIAWPLDALTISPYQTKYHLEGFHTVQPFFLRHSVWCVLCQKHDGQRSDKAMPDLRFLSINWFLDKVCLESRVA